MNLYITTGSDQEYMNGRAINIPANSSDFLLDNATDADIEVLNNKTNVTAVKVEFETGDLVVVVPDITEPTDATGGATTAAITFALKDKWGLPVKGAYRVNLGVFSDAALVTADAAATLATATKGTITGGTGTAALVVTTDANGEFACTLTDATDGTVYLGVWGGSPGMPVVDGSDIVDVEFSA